MTVNIRIVGIDGQLLPVDSNSTNILIIVVLFYFNSLYKFYKKNYSLKDPNENILQQYLDLKLENGDLIFF